MSTSIDERVVSMKFDNQQFENNVKTSISTIDRLKQSLNFNGMSKGLEEINDSSRKLNFSGISNGIETVRAKFSSLEVMAMTALANITNSAVNAGKKIVSSFTIDPIKTGLEEYETQINAVQTILANTESKGSTLKDVNGALDELNKYADKTIYNFTEMTRNIGTFTAAGVDLDTSVSAIKGIANLAAVSGSNSQQASTAMYQLSQALASGTVKLQDWNSVVNAGMGGQVFQDSLKETARVHGVKIDEMIKKEGSFRETLKNGWLSSEILTETLSKFTGDLNEKQLKSMGYTDKQIKGIMKMGNTANDAATKVKTFTQLMDTLKEAAQSGWTQTWELLIGDFKEAKNLWSSASDFFSEAINNSAEARNKLVKGWVDFGGRDAAIDALKNAFKALSSIITPIKEAFREIFPPTTAGRLVEITRNIRDLTKSFILSDEAAEKLKTVFKGLFSAIDIGWTFVKKLGSGLSDILGDIFGFSDGLLDIAVSISEYIIGVRDSINETGKFNEVISTIIAPIKKVIEYLKELQSSGLDGISDGFRTLWNFIKSIGSKILDVLSKLGEGIAKVFNNLGIEGIITIIKNVASAGLIVTLTRFVKTIRDRISDSASIFEKFLKHGESIVGSFSNILSGVEKCLVSFQNNIRSKSLLTTAIAIGILTLSLVTLSGIKTEDLNKALAAITTSFGELIGVLTVISRLSSNGLSLNGSALALVGISTAVLILSSALKKLSSLNMEEIKKGLTGITGLMAIVVGATKLLSTNSEKAIKGAVQMVIFSAAIKILCSACKDMAEMSWDGIKKGLTGVGILMAEISAFLNTAKFSKKAVSNAIGTLILSSAMKILASVCQDFASMDWEKMGKGLAGVGGILAEFSLFANSMQNTDKLIKIGAMMTIIGLSLRILEKSMITFSKMSWDELSRGLVGMSAALLSVSIMARLMPQQGLIDISIVLPSVASALVIMAKAMKKIGSMSWEELARSIVGIGSSLTFLVAAMQLMQNSIGSAMAMFVASTALLMLSNALKIAGSLGWIGVAVGLTALAGAFAIIGVSAKLIAPLVPSIFKLSASIASLGLSFVILGAGLGAIGTGMAAALTPLVTTILALQNVSWGSIVKGLVAIAGVFAVIGVSASLLKPLVPTILSLSGSLFLLGVSCLTVGIAISLVVSSLATLGAMGPNTANTIVNSLETIIVGFVNMLPKVITGLVETVKSFIFGIVKLVRECGPEIIDGILKTIVDVLGSLAENIPNIIENLGKMIVGALSVLSKYVPEIVNFLVDFLVSAINAVAERIPELVEAAVNLFSQLFSAIGAALNNVDGDSLLKASVAVAIMAVLTRVLAGTASLIPGAMVGLLGVGILIGELALILAAIGALAQIPGLEWLINEGGDLLQAVGTAIGKFVGGIVGGIAAGVTASLPQVGTNLSQFMTNIKPFIEGAKTITPESLSGVKSLVGVITILTAANIFDGIATFLTGESSLEKFSRQIIPFGKAMAEFSSIVSGNVDQGAVTAAANAGKAIAEMADTIPNSGGVAGWFAGENDLTDFAKQLVPFGKAMVEFSSVVSGNIDEGAVSAAANAGKAIAEMADTIPNSGGVAGWFAGENDLTDFAKQLVPFGEAMAEFSSVVSGNIDDGAVTAAANAGKAIAEMASTLPNSGGVAGWFAGENDLDTFYKQLVPFGEAMAEFSSVVSGNIDDGAVTAAANAGKAIAEMSDALPNHGGVASWFAGDNDYLGSFCDNIASFGEAMVEFSSVVSGNIDEGAVTAAANAGKAIAEMSATLPNSGGVAGWFSGDVDFEDFTENIVSFGYAMSEFSEKVKNIRPEAVKAAADAGKTLVNMVKDLPDDGDLSTAFENLATSFPTNLSSLGEGIASFSNAVANKNIDNKNVKAASDALTTITTIFKKENSSLFSTEFKGDTLKANLSSVGDGVAGFCSKLSTKGIDTEKANTAADIIKTVTGTFINNKISKFMEADIDFGAFSTKLSQLGAAVTSFSKSVSGEKTDTESINKVIDVLDNLPDMNKISNFVSSGVDFNAFGKKLKSMGKAIRNFAKSVSGKKIDIEPANKAASTIGNVIDNLPDKEKVSSFIDSGINYGDFGNKLVKMGKAIVKFSNVFVDKKVNLDPAKNAIGVLSNLMDNLPDTKKVVEFTNSDAEYGKFGNKLTSIGKAMVKFSNSVSGKKFDSKSATSAITLSKKIMKNLPSTDKVNSFANSDAKFGAFGNKLVSLGNAMVKFSNSVAGKVKTSDVNAAIKTCKSLVNMANGMGDANFGKLSSFSSGLKKLGSAQVDKFVSAFKNSGSKLNSAGATMAKNLDKGIKANLPAIKMSAKSASTSAVNGFKSKQTDAVKAGEELIKKFASGFSKAEGTAYKKAGALAKKAVAGARNEYNKFESAGKYLGKGLEKGLEAKRQSIYDKGASLAKSANKGFTDSEKIESPSKVWYGFGGYMVEGLTNALGDGEKDVNKSTSGIAKKSTKSLSKALSKVSDMLSMDIDSQPTIRPVLDLSDISDGAGAINSMFDMQPSVDVMSDVRSINSMMNDRQNGNYELLSAVKGLRKDIADSNGGVTVDVHLDYNAGSDANEIATDIATSLRRALRRGI